jgi:Na+/melibiose symporter-like transporter
MRRLLGVRDARIFFVGWSLSSFGDSAMFLVLGIWAKDLTGSNAAAGLVFFVLVLPSFLAPIAGLLVDRLRRRPLLIGAYSVEGLAVLSLVFVHGRGDLWLIYVVAAIYGACGTVAASARSALMTVILPRELLGEANAVFQTVREGLRLLSPLVGAGLYAAFGGASVAIMDAATFSAVIVAVALMRTPEPRFERVEHRFVTELLAGARHIFHTAPLRQIILAAGVALLVIGFAETLIFAVIDEGLHRDTSFLGVLSALQGGGSILGGLTSARALRRLGDVWLVGLGLLMFAVGDFALISSNLTLVLTGFFVAGVSVAWIIVGFGTAIQLRTPARLQGRVASAAETLVAGPQTLSIALGALLISVVDYRLLVVVMSTITALCAAYLLTRGPEPVSAAEESAVAVS